MGRRSLRPSVVTEAEGLRRRSSVAFRAARPGHRGVSSCGELCVWGVRCSGLRAISGVGSFEPDNPAERAHPSRAGCTARLAAVGVLSRAQLVGLGSRAVRGALAVGRAAAAALPRGLRPRAHRAARRGPPAGRGARLRPRRGPQPPDRGLALGPPAQQPDAHRRHRPSRPPRRPGDPPAPLSFPRCPGHHQPPGHPAPSHCWLARCRRLWRERLAFHGH